MIRSSNICDAGLCAWLSCVAITTAMLCGAAFGAEPAALESLPRAEILSLTVDEATALFLKQNLELLIAQYGIESAKGLEVTARLFPNPVLSVDASTSTTRP